MQHSFVSPVTGQRETPIRLLIKHFPDLAKKVSKFKCSLSHQYFFFFTSTLEFRIHLSNFIITQVFDNCIATNLQMSVLNFSHGAESNIQNKNDNYGDKNLKHAVSSDDPQFTITFNYELLDDSYCLLSQGLKG